MTKSRLTFGLVSAAVFAAYLSAVSVAHAKDLRVAFFATSAQNGFDGAIYEGIQTKAKELGIETAIYGAEYDSGKQYSQIEDVLASGKFDAFIVEPNDSVGIASAIEKVAAKKIPVAAVLFPIGPDLSNIEPQVEGVTVTVANPPAAGAKTQAETIVDYCKDKDPCNVVILIGNKVYPFDNLRYETYQKILGEHQNIHIVATGEGSYDADKSMAAMQDILQANPKVNAILSNADQHLVGAEIALQSAGIQAKDVFMSGGGGATVAVEAVREGRWGNTLAYYPRTMGELALVEIAKALKGEPVKASINMDTVGPLPAILDKKVLDAHPDFKGEWAQ
jgi:ribose transport system substrate-binding protein